MSNGEKLVVLIEIQKAKFTTDLIRFRKYLTEQYGSKQNTIEQKDKIIPLPIITIYFLGYGLDYNKNIPLIRVKRHYLDNYNGDILQGRELFIETLTHDSIIVQIPALKKQRRNDLEKALSVFEVGKTRLRPILMTTLSMVFGMMPIALATGAGAEWKSGLAWVLIGGLSSSMILTLVVVPAVYLIVEIFSGTIKKKAAKVIMSGINTEEIKI